MIKRIINKILKSIDNLPAQYKVALARILTGMIESIDYINKKIENLGGGDWNENDNTKPGYIKNRTHYRESVLPAPIVRYDIQAEFVEGTIEDVLNYLDNNTYIYTIDINCGKYKYIKNNNEIINNLKIGYGTDAEMGVGSFNVSLYDNDTWIENLIVFKNIYEVDEEKEYFLNIINLFCDNIDDVYRLKKSITINNVNYVLDESELEYVYHKLDKNYLPNTDIITKITYSELKTLRDSNQLIPGKKYRIIDYIPVFEGNINYARYAGNQFDIIVTALSNNELSENASAIKHEGDNYFNYRHLNLWQIKYNIDNLYMYQWVHHINGKGVIYWMKDEWGNECPYDFVNIQFKRLVNDTNYDWFYTFNVNENIQYCVNNKIKPYYNASYGQYILNNIVFKNAYNCYNNVFNEDCYNITFFANSTNKGSITSNIFGSGCYNINFECPGNINVFNDGCHDITFTYNCDSNIFSNNCNNINLNNCRNNSFGINCNNITLIRCEGNIFKNDCNNITFQIESHYNIFENDCNHIIFDKRYTQYIKVESGNKYITLTTQSTTSSSSPLKNITIGQGVNNNNDESLRKTIIHPTANDMFKTIYQNSNSKIIDV